MQGDPDIVVIGSGPNGLVAACLLAQQGFRVAVLEAHPRRPGGPLGTEEITAPGFAHDLGPGFFPMAAAPALRDLALPSTGLRWRHAPFATCHLGGDGSHAAIGRDIDATAAHFGSEEDGTAWRALAARQGWCRSALDEVLLGRFPSLRALLRLGPRDLLHLARVSLSSASTLGQRWFVTEAARRVFAQLALQAHRGPSARDSGPLGYGLALAAASTGFPLPAGGARSITNALVTVLERHGGQLLLGAVVRDLVVREGRVVAVRLERGGDLAVSRGVLADVPWTRLLLDLVAACHWPSRSVRRAEAARGARPRTTTARLHWALAGPIPWTCEAATRAAVVHSAHWALTQPSLFDPGRAPPGRHTASCTARFVSEALKVDAPPHEGLVGLSHGSTRRPEGSARLRGGTARPHRDSVQLPEDVASGLEERIEALAPGFRARILGRHAASWSHEECPPPAYLRHTTSVRGLYLCSDDTPPGPGLHGMCGALAARRAARDLG